VVVCHVWYILVFVFGDSGFETGCGDGHCSRLLNGHRAGDGEVIELSRRGM